MKKFITTSIGILFMFGLFGQANLFSPTPQGQNVLTRHENTNYTYAQEIVWDRVYQLPAKQMAMSIAVIDEQTVWAYSIGYTWENPPVEEHFLYRTIDGGSTWQIKDAPGKRLYIYAKDSLKLWVSDVFSGIMCTKDGGITWDTVFKTERFGPIHFFNDNEGIFIGCNNNDYDFSNADSVEIYRTTNGGVDWVKINTAQYGGVLAGECIAAPNYETMDIHGDSIYFGTTKNRIFYSYNKGETWNLMNSPFTGNVVISAVRVMNKNNITLLNIGTMIGSTPTFNTYAKLAITLDGGATWQTNACFDLCPSMSIADIPGTDSIIFIGSYFYFWDNYGDRGSPGTMISTDYGQTYTLIDSLSNLRLMEFINYNTGMQ